MSLMMSFAVSPIFYGAALACGQSFEYETFVVASTSDDIMINSKRPMICFSVNAAKRRGRRIVRVAFSRWVFMFTAVQT
ncbi:hypothetical protein CPB85DRAFT_1371063, partial [Mucidula mucida]